MILRKETVDTYKGYKIRIKEQEPSVTKPETEEEWDKLLESADDLKGTHSYKVEDADGRVIWEDDKNMWDKGACYDNGIQDIESHLKIISTLDKDMEVKNV